MYYHILYTNKNHLHFAYTYERFFAAYKNICYFHPVWILHYIPIERQTSVHLLRPMKMIIQGICCQAYMN